MVSVQGVVWVSLLLLVTGSQAASSHRLLDQPGYYVEEQYPDMRISPPCPLAQDIFPCTCYNSSTARTFIKCEGITEEWIAYRALHVDGYGPNPVASFGMQRGTVKTISNGLFSERTFEDVMLYNNEIETVEPGTLDPLMFDLRAINLDYNRLRHSIVDQLLGFVRLYSIDLGYNLIEDISDMADLTGTIPSLQTLDFGGNLLTFVPANAFKSTPNIVMIILSENNIKYVDPAAFVDLVAVDYISLDGNDLNHLGSPEVGKVVLPRPIWSLDLGNSNITSMEPGFVEGYSDRFELILDENPMRHFPEEVFGDVLRTIAISDAWGGVWHALSFYKNYIDCDCEFLWVAEDYWLNAHLRGGYCGNKTDRPRKPIDAIDAEELKDSCVFLPTEEPTNPKGAR